MLNGPLSVEDLDSVPRQGGGPGRVEVVDCQPQAALAAMRPHQICNLGGPKGRELVHPRTGCDVRPGHRWADFVDRAEIAREVFRPLKLEQDHGSLGGDEDVPRRVPEQEHLHVPCAGRKAQIHRVVENTCIEVAHLQLLPEAGETEACHFQPVTGGRGVVGRCRIVHDRLYGATREPR